jgi:citrate synthase
MRRVDRIVKHVNMSAPLSQAPVSTGSKIVGLLKQKIAVLAKERSALKATLLKEHGDTKIQDLTVEMAINGARGIKSMVTETSDLDASDGIFYRGKSLFDVNKELPKASGGEAGLPEAAFWLLLTGEIPSAEETRAFTEELHRRASIPDHVLNTMDAVPADTHPMTQLSIALLALQKESKFQKQYDIGMKKGEYWEYALEDALDIAARIPVVAAKIYRRTFFDGVVPKYNADIDWAGNYAHMLGINDGEAFKEVTRLYLMLHADHEGGNVSAHTTHLVGSALSDPYYSLAAGLCGLAGPLHGLANQECLAWLLEVQADLKKHGQEPTKEVMEEYTRKQLASGKVVPGFGHAVLRKPDPRYLLEREFALKHCKDDPLFKLVDACYQAIPGVLGTSGKIKNPHPNVDAHSGQLMHYYNLKQETYYTVVFAVSRSLGCLSQYVWARAIGLPIERPKSIPLDKLAALARK